MTLLQLPAGRQLEIEISGPEGGLPLVFHHGTPGSSRPFRFVEQAAHRRGLRLVTYSRPGYGRSTRQAGRRVVDAAADVTAILTELRAPRCLVAGWSGGGPHALATAAILGPTVAGVLVIAGLAPHDAADLDFLDGMGEQNLAEFAAADGGEATLRPSLEREATGLVDTDAAGLIAGLRSLLPAVDQSALTAGYGADLAANFAAALQPGVDGWVDDDLAFLQSWGFDLDTIAAPTFVWQGSEDLMVPFAHGQWLAGRLPGAVTHLERGQGHLSISVAGMDRMLDELTSSAR